MGSLADHIASGLYPDETNLSISDRMLRYFASIHAGEGSPEGTVIAPVGSTYMDIDTGISYTKRIGTGNTGWVQEAGTSDIPGLKIVSVLAADYTNATGGFTTALSGIITPTETKVYAEVKIVGTNGGTQQTIFEIQLQGSISKPLGSMYTPAAASQWSFTQGAVFTGLTPGEALTFNVRAKVDGNTFYCRPASFPDSEQMVLTLENVS